MARPRSQATPPSAPAEPGPIIPLRTLWRPPVAAEFLFGLSPLIGLVWWGWDSYLVLMTHLLAIGLSGGWLAVRMATLSREAVAYFESGKIPFAGRKTRWLLAGFIVAAFAVPLVVFAGLATEQYGGAWSQAVHGPGDFWRIVVVLSGLWMQLAAVMFWEAISFIGDVVLPRLPFGRFQPTQRPVGAPYDGLSRELQAYLYIQAFVVLRMVVIVLAVGIGLVLNPFGAIAIVVLLVLLKTGVGVFIEAGAVVDRARRRK